MAWPSVILLINLIATWYLVGLIWTIQIVHYRQFDLVGETNWLDYHRRHTSGISWIVAPAMLIELASSVGLIIYRPPGMADAIAWGGVIVVGLIWMSTAFLQVPIHNKLAKGFDANACRSLTAGNWVRTILWTIRGVLLAYAVFQARPAVT